MNLSFNMHDKRDKKNIKAGVNIPAMIFVLLVGLTVIFILININVSDEHKTKAADTLTTSAVTSVQKAAAEKSDDDEEVEATEEYLLTESSSIEKVQKVYNYDKSLAGLEEQINNALYGYYGTWSVYVKDLKDDTSISINDQQLYAASLIKLYALAGAYQQIDEGLIEEKDVADLIDAMITVSDNESFNSLVMDIGTTYINAWCSENGYYETYQCHGLYPSTNGDYITSAVGYNLTSVDDCGKLLESIYRGECVSEEASEKMLSYLLRQEVVTKIPQGLPVGTKCANKTGETDDCCYDSAIVYTDAADADYVICVMCYDEGAGYAHEEEVAAISKITYDYFNDSAE